MPIVIEGQMVSAYWKVAFECERLTPAHRATLVALGHSRNHRVVITLSFI
jgi:hypothetical protein